MSLVHNVRMVAFVGKGPRVPGGLALGTFLALALGVSLWWIVDTLFPALGRAVRGPDSFSRGV